MILRTSKVECKWEHIKENKIFKATGLKRRLDSVKLELGIYCVIAIGRLNCKVAFGIHTAAIYYYDGGRRL